MLSQDGTSPPSLLMLGWGPPAQSFCETTLSSLQEASGTHIWSPSHLGIMSEAWEERSRPLKCDSICSCFSSSPENDVEWELKSGKTYAESGKPTHKSVQLFHIN